MAQATAQQSAVETAETDNSTNNAAQTVDTRSAETGAAGNDAKQAEQQEVSPYQKQLDELNAALKTKEDIIEKKNRALEAEKERRKEAEAKAKAKLEETEEERDNRLLDKAKEMLRQELTSKELESKLASLTSDPVEREVIKKHYEGSIVKTGNLDTDLQRALAVANANLVAEQRARARAIEGQENFLTGYQSSDLRGASDSKYKDPVVSMAANFLKNIGQEAAIKHLK